MRWNDESSYDDRFGGEPGFESLHASDIIDDAFYEGYIGWYAFCKARERINIMRNGTWMFEDTAVPVSSDTSPSRQHQPVSFHYRPKTIFVDRLGQWS